MQSQILSPALEHTEEATLSAQMPGLLQYVLDRLGSAGEEESVEDLGMVAAKPTQLLRQREGDHEVIHGKTVFQLGAYPLGRISGSAPGA